MVSFLQEKNVIFTNQWCDITIWTMTLDLTRTLEVSWDITQNYILSVLKVSKFPVLKLHEKSILTQAILPHTQWFPDHSSMISCHSVLHCADESIHFWQYVGVKFQMTYTVGSYRSFEYLIAHNC